MHYVSIANIYLIHIVALGLNYTNRYLSGVRVGQKLGQHTLAHLFDRCDSRTVILDAMVSERIRFLVTGITISELARLRINHE